MNANELRIGNWVERIDIGFSGAKKVVFQIRHLDIIHHESYSPIPLTTEILDKCGFWANRFDVPSFEINDMATHLELIEANGFYYPSIDQMQDIGPSQNVSLTRIQYLHQLQNLIFTLTNEELNYTP